MAACRIAAGGRRIEPVRDVTTRRFEMEPGKLLLHIGFGFASGALATVVVGTHQSRGTPMEWWQVMGDHKRVEVRNVHDVRFYRSVDGGLPDDVRSTTRLLSREMAALTIWDWKIQTDLGRKRTIECEKPNSKKRTSRRAGAGSRTRRSL